jgi:hypothetical protein
MRLERLLYIPPDEATFAKRRFQPGRGDAQFHLEKIGCMFLAGYNAAIELDSLSELGRRLDSVESELRGFAFEGAAMALSLRDHLTPWRRADRFTRFLRGIGEPHTYMVLVGAGWSYARIPWLRFRVDQVMGREDPLLWWLTIDGFGFHEGYFAWAQAGARRRIPRSINGYGRRAFDQGLGRSAWFANCADAARVSAWICGFEEGRRPDLWSGVGLACTYAGGATESGIAELCAAGQKYRADLAQGAAFAAKTRLRAGNLVPHTESACWMFCGISAIDAAAVTDAALKNLPEDGLEPAYEVWRARIRREFTSIRTF